MRVFSSDDGGLLFIVVVVVMSERGVQDGGRADTKDMKRAKRE